MDHDTAMNTGTLERYLLRELSETERDAFEEHYFSCPICAREVVLASKFLDNARIPLQRVAHDGVTSTAERERVPAPTGKERPSTPAPTRPRASWWDRWLALAPKPVLAAACVLLAAALLLRPAEPGQDGPRITGSYFVTAVRSGNEPRRIQVEKSQRLISLLFNRTDASVGRYAFVLEQAGGAVVLEFEGTAPRDTDDIQVLIPVERLRAGPYILRVRDANKGAEVAVLPFQIAFQ
jgi:anti-sigma factor RsiW